MYLQCFKGLFEHFTMSNNEISTLYLLESWSDLIKTNFCHFHPISTNLCQFKPISATGLDFFNKSRLFSNPDNLSTFGPSFEWTKIFTSECWSGPWARQYIWKCSRICLSIQSSQEKFHGFNVNTILPIETKCTLCHP